VNTFKLSKDPFFIHKVRDIVGLYLAPPARALLCSIDERKEGQIQALDRAHNPRAIKSEGLRLSVVALVADSKSLIVLLDDRLCGAILKPGASRNCRGAP